MKLLTFYLNDALHLGVKTDKGILDITAAAPAGVPATMDDYIAGGEAAQKALESYVAEVKDAAYLAEEGLKFASCVPHPGKIVGVGLNYVKYMVCFGSKKPDFPHLFPKFPEAICGHGDPVVIPYNSEQGDFEGELAVVIGKKARLVKEEDALEYVLGYCCANDMTCRDFQNATTSWVPGKCCDGFAPIGPYLVTVDEVPDPNHLQVKTWVNGELKQDFNTDDMIRDVKFLISGISRFFTLNPGDVILTGTSLGHILCEPEEQRVWLKEGDVMEVEVEGLGRLVNPVIKEKI